MRQYDIDTLEHESELRPLGEYPDHCGRCAQTAATRELQAACAHEDTSEIRTFGGGVVARVCVDCGSSLNVYGSV